MPKPKTQPDKPDTTGALPLSTNGAHELSITITGAEHAVRRAVNGMSFSDEWNPLVTRQIALDETGVADATLDDTLGGAKIGMFDPDVRDLYRQRCINEASHRGHPVANPDSIPNGADTTIRKVGDELFNNSRH
jgi:hypothetical protein